LEVEDIFERAVEAVGPEMRTGCRVDQLPSDAHPLASLAHRAFEHVADAELTPDLLHIDRLALVGKGRIAGDDKEPTDARERGDDLLDHAVREIFLLRVATHIGERQDRDRRLVGQSRAGDGLWHRRLQRRNYSVSSDGSRDVLEHLLADVFKGEIELAR